MDGRGRGLVPLSPFIVPLVQPPLVCLFVLFGCLVFFFFVVVWFRFSSTSASCFSFCTA
jgi:hypothetical protein